MIEGRSLFPISPRSSLIVPGGLNRASFHHQNDRALRRTGSMNDSSRNGVALMDSERDRFIFQINQKFSLQHEKEFVLFVVLMPVKLALHDAESHDAVVHLAKSLVVPLVIAGGDEAGHINQLEKTELGIQIDRIVILFAHRKFPCGALSTRSFAAWPGRFVRCGVFSDM